MPNEYHVTAIDPTRSNEIIDFGIIDAYSRDEAIYIAMERATQTIIPQISARLFYQLVNN